jgi:hypothetical protein
MGERKHYVTFLSPGTLFSEETTRRINEWSIEKAVAFAGAIVERHGARPYGFYFTTRLEVAPVDDGEGGKLKVEPREVARSGLHHLGGKLVRLDEIDRNDPKLKTLVFNMECNGYSIVVENRNSYLSTHLFEETDVLVDPMTSTVIARGDAPEHVAYRAMVADALKKKRAGGSDV